MLQNKINFSTQIVRSNFGLLENPYKLIFCVTKECHSKCENCHIWKQIPQDELTLDEINQISKNNSYLSWLNFTGGEPTDRKDFTEIVESFIRNCPKLALINFPTNGLNKKRILEHTRKILALRHPQLVVSVSIDGPHEVNDQLRGIKNSFRRAVEVYQELTQLKGLKVLMSMTLYSENHLLIDETVRSIKQFVPNFNYRDLHLNIPNMSEHFYGNHLAQITIRVDLPKSVAKYLKKRGTPKSTLDWLEYGYQKRIESFVTTGKTPVNCKAVSASVYLSEKGELFPCTTWSESLGNVRTSNYSISSLLKNSSKLQEIKNKIANKKCPDCWSSCEAAQSIAGQLFRPSFNFLN